MKTGVNHVPIIWDCKFETGIAEIDEQHKMLMDILNEAGLLISKEPSRKNLLSITCELLEYALYHFEDEERLMFESGYHQQARDEAETHQRQHRHFSEWIVSFREQLRSDELLSPAILLDFVKHWLFEHILITDKKLGAHLLGSYNDQADRPRLE